MQTHPRTLSPVALLGLAAATCLLFAHPALAQDAAAVVAEPAAAAGSKISLFQRIMGGGPAFMGTLMLTSVFMFWLVLDGFLRSGRQSLAPAKIIADLRAHLSAGDYEAAAASASASDTVFGRVSFAAFGKVGRGAEATEDALFEQLERERAHFAARISYLSVIGVITPMIGLTGTVFGMIKAFDTLGQAGVGDPGKLSAAIGTVLVATAGGLVVAIPAFAFYYVLRNRISGGFRHVQNELNAIFHHLPYDELAGYRLDPDTFVPASPRAPSAATDQPEAEPAAQ